MRMASLRRFTILLLVLFCVFVPTAALGATVATARQTAGAAGVASWAIVIAPYGSSPAYGAPVSSPQNTDHWFTFTNVGTATLGPRFSVAVPMSSDAGTGAAQLEYCDVGWNIATDACTGPSGTATGTVTAVAVAGSTNAFTLPPSFPPGTSLVLRMHPNITGSYTATFGVSVSNNTGTGVTTNG